MASRLPLLLSCLLLPFLHSSLLLPSPCAAEDAVSYEGYSLYRLRPSDASQLSQVTEFIEAARTSSVRKIDVWREPTRVNNSVDILVAPDFQPEFKSSFAHFNLSVAIANIQRDIDREASEKAPSWKWQSALLGRNSSWGRVLRDFATPGFSFDRYHSLDQIHAYMRKLKRENPHIVQLTTIGRGHEDGKLIVMQIASSVGDIKNKPSIWIDGGIHAREWVSPATVLYFMSQLVQGYKARDRNIVRLVDEIAWYFLPVMNPDGYRHSFTADRMWRKNRRKTPAKRRRWGCDSGVDLNRNFDWHHCGLGASKSPCSEIYCGKYPFSEPESQAVSRYVKKLKRDRNLMAYLTLHSYSQIWMYPYGHAKRAYASNHNELKRLARKAASALQKVHGTKYHIGTAADTLYEAAGGSDDWAHGKAGVRYVFLVELRPCDECNAGFILPAGQIKATGEETWAGVKEVAKQVRRDFKRSQSKAKAKASVRRKTSSGRRSRGRIRVIRPMPTSRRG